MIVKVDLGVVPLAVSTLEAGLEVGTLDANVLSRVVESHCDRWVGERL